MKRWVIADTHFGHQMLVDSGYRPDDYNERTMRNWLRMVGAHDLVIHLGDVALPDSRTETWVTLSALPGRKILVMGNHDKRSAKWYMERGFAFACDSFELSGIIFTHRPLAVVPEHARYNIHGHLHAGQHREHEPHAKHRLVSLEDVGYMPIAVDKAIRAVERKPTSNDS